MRNDGRKGAGGGKEAIFHYSFLHSILYCDFQSRSNILTRKSSGDHQVKRRKEVKPMLEEQEGMPQHHDQPISKPTI
jgi:hypothetical protein